MRLDPDSLEVQTFAMSSSDGSIGDCCTGCVSGCGINPTATGTCESQGETWEYWCKQGDTLQQFDAAAAN
jgi:hypothetical protein